MKVLGVTLLLISEVVIAQGMQAFDGVCSVASISQVRGFEGIKVARPLEKEKFYIVSGSSKTIEIDWKNKKVTYFLKDSSGEFGEPNSLAIYSSKDEEAWLYFREKGPPIFHTEPANSSDNTWGSCLLIDSRVTAANAFEKLKEENFIKLNRVTTAGEIKSCELEYQYTYKDVRSQSGYPVILTGAFVINYNEKKPPSFFLKVNASVMNTDAKGWHSIKPEFANITVNGRSFKSNKIGEFTCESGGACIGYGDPKLELLGALTSKYPFDGEISLSLVKGGMDHSFFLSKIISQAKAGLEQRKFNTCTLEIIQKVTKESR